MKTTKKSRRGKFTKGNQIAAKERWDTERLATFQSELKAARERVGFTYAQMGEAMGFTAAYVALIEGAYKEQRQPSQKFLDRFEEVKDTLEPKPDDWKIPAATLRVINRHENAKRLWSHVLGKKFICPECRTEVERGERAKGFDVWWASTPNQKHCPQHQPRTKRRRSKK